MQQLIRKLIAMAFIVLMVSPAHAALQKNGQSFFPGTDRDELKEFFQTLRNPNRGNMQCCGDPDPDCRPVHELRRTEDKDGMHYQALIERRYFVESEWAATTWASRFGDATEVWLDVPDRAVVTRTDNPTGDSIGCWSLNMNDFYCLVPWESGS